MISIDLRQRLNTADDCSETHPKEHKSRILDQVIFPGKNGNIDSSVPVTNDNEQSRYAINGMGFTDMYELGSNENIDAIVHGSGGATVHPLKSLLVGFDTAKKIDNKLLKSRKTVKHA